MDKLTIEDLDVRAKKVLVRVDFNVPLRDGRVEDDQRIVASLPTLRYALDSGASLILMSHLGRPKGRVAPEYSLRPIASNLESHLGFPVAFARDCVGPESLAAASRLGPQGVLLLENLRFHPGEENPDREPGFAEALARLGERYVNDAFGTAHRAHASIVAVAELFDEPAAGLLMAREIDVLGKALSSPEHPFLAILGGAKVSDKIPLIENLLDKVDGLVIGGAMAYTFLAARGNRVGSSRVEADLLELSRELLARAACAQVEMLLPSDHVCGREFSERTRRQVTRGPDIDDGWMGLDIGPKTIEAYAERIRRAKTLLWNGPMGVFEWEPFAAGTMAIARDAAESRALSIVGGGDSAVAARRSGMAERFSHISTGGGATLEFLEGKPLPGVDVLASKKP